MKPSMFFGLQLARFSFALVIATAMVCSGCSTLNMNRSAKLDAQTQGGPSYKVIFSGTRGKAPKVYAGTITGDITVQQALEQSGATRKYKGMLVDVARRTKSGEILRLAATFDANQGRVIDHENYAIHPGDEILVRPANPSTFDTFVKLMNNGDMPRR